MARGCVISRNGGYTAIWDEPRGDNGKRKQRTKGGFKTKKTAEEFLRDQLSAFGGLRLQALTADRLTRFYRQLSASGHRYGGGLAPKTVRNIHGAIHKALAKALADPRKWGYITHNAPGDADPPKIKSVKARSRERKVWSPEQLRRFLESVRDDRLFAAWMLLATTGLRRGEVMGLRWTDLDLRRAR